MHVESAQARQDACESGPSGTGDGDARSIGREAAEGGRRGLFTTASALLRRRLRRNARRKELMHLLELDDYLLKDVGLARDDVLTSLRAEGVPVSWRSRGPAAGGTSGQCARADSPPFLFW